MPPGASEHHRRLQVIGVSAAALRRRVDALTADGGARGGEVQAALAEAKRLMAGLKPLVEVAAEFRLKWQRQRQQLLAQREAEIDCCLRQEAEARLQATESAFKEELEAVRHNSEQRAHVATLAASREHDGELQLAVDVWRERTPGAEAVRAGDVNKAVRRASSRLGEWAAEHERRLMGSWKSEVAEIVTRVHTLDEEAMVALQETHAARRSILDNNLRRHRREVASCRAELQERVASLAEALASAGEAGERRTPAQRASEAAALARAARDRVAKAKGEAEAATAAHLKRAVAEFDAFANEGLLRRPAFRKAMAQAEPVLSRRLDGELGELAQAAETTLAAAAPHRQHPSSGSSAWPGAVASPLQRAEGGTRDQQVEEEEEETARAARTARTQRIIELRQRLKETQAALSRGNWRCDWRRDISEISELGLPRLRFTEAALEKQAAVLRGADAMQQDLASLGSATRALARAAESHAEGVHREYVRIRNAKVALARSRAALVQETTRQFSRSNLEAEEALLPAVTKLAHEAETLREVAHAVRRGAQRVPVNAVAGAWRRTVAASFLILQRIWDAAAVPEQERRQAVCQLMALLERQPGAAAVLRRESLQRRPGSASAPHAFSDGLGCPASSSGLLSSP